ncbi:hypothetical protein VaNZ11_010318 [Volvox africanus]|uniref:SET domain-containing protein n=1 Tax=Volvox africanus TaxID=51714 RepID=A0ABQ5S982_9CHLO|nr:hypothetical protein VaNZ11_010318 [Volvox africanus]
MAVVRQFYRGDPAGVVHPVWLQERHLTWQPRGLHCKVAAPVVLAAAGGPALNITAAQPPLLPITAQSIWNWDILTPQQPLTQVEEEVGHPPEAYCQADNLSGLLRQFGAYQEGFDNGLQLDGLMAYYRRLGCSAEQLQDAVYNMMPPIASSSSARRAGGPGRISRIMAQPDLDLPPASGTQVGATAAPADFTLDAGAGGSVSRTSYVQFSEPLWQLPGSLGEQVQLAAWELLAATLAAVALAAYESRPRGWSRRDLLEVRQSNIAGRGVFARAPIAAGTVLGAYPGRLRSALDMVAKCQEAPLAASYAFRTGDGRFLDPTDASGQPSPYPQPGWPWPLPMDVILSYANEPPKGSPGTNTTVEDGPHPGDLLFVAASDIPPGAEVLIDYGMTYDRSGYDRTPVKTGG